MHCATITSVVSRDDFLAKLAAEFTTDEQRVFADHFTAYLAYIHAPDAFVVDLDEAVEWLGFSRRDAAVRIVRAKFVEGVDF